MSVALSPIVSEFETEEQKSEHDQWFRAKVQEALSSPIPRVPHSEALERVQSTLTQRRADRAENRKVG